jgi:hypothetical protein
MVKFNRRIQVPLMALALGGLVMASATAAGAAPGKPPATGDRKPVIVVLRNQHAELPAKSAAAQRRSTTQREQAPLADKARAGGATGVKHFSVINGFAATMSPAQVAQMQADPNVAAVVPDRLTRLQPLGKKDIDTIKAQAGPAAGPDRVLPGSCPSDPSKPLLEPEALQTTQTEFTDGRRPQAHQLATGKGVTVGWIADGIDPKNPDFIRPDGTPVFTDYQDFSGTDPDLGGGGGEAFGDASSIAAQGNVVYDLSKFVNAAHPLPAGCNIRVKGIAPGASLVGINVFGSSNFVINSLILQAIDYAVTVANVDVLNESFGGNAYPTDGIDPVALADEAAVAAGVTVVASTGDAGPFNTIGSPAVNPAVISVGATTTFRSVSQIGYAGTRNFATSWASDNAAPISSDGITARGRVPDLVAPGQDGWAVCTADPVRFANCTNFNNQPSNLEDFGGTSESSPFVAGGAALVIEAYKSTHGGVRPSPALVKQILTSTATDLGLPATQQGAGEMNTYRAVRLAQSIKDGNGSPTPKGDGLLVRAADGDTQLTATGNAGAGRDIPLKVTNTGAITQTLSAHGRILGTKLSDLKGSIPLDVTSAATPSFLDGIAGPAGPVVRRYNTTTFKVPVGADHLTGVLSWPGGGANGQSSVRLALIGPNGEYETHSLPQGAGNHGQVDIRFPAPGTWTAVFFASASATGFHGNVQFRFTTTKYKDFGDVSPRSLTLKPGETGTFHVKVKLPGDAGDLSAAVEIDNGFHGRTAIPLTLRTLLSTSNDGGAFSGFITGGNGRGNVGEQTQTYVFDVPKGKKDLGIDLTLAGDPNQPVFAALLSPDHQVLSLSTNDGTKSLQGYVRDPAPGRWLLFINVNNPVAGTELADKFTGHLRYNLVDIKASGVPSGTVKAGTPIPVTVTVKNTGAAPAAFFADPRRTNLVDYDLVTQLGTSSTATIPFDVSALGPTWLVPTQTSTVTFQQSSTVPADFDASTLINGVPEVYGAPQGLTAIATLSAARVSQGLWSAQPTALGPTNGPVTGTVQYSVVAHTKAFDDTVTSSTGDAWLSATHASNPFTPLVLQPGQTGTITVTFTPTGAAGTTVSGVLYVDTFSASVLTGDELTAIPYSYTIG